MSNTVTAGKGGGVYADFGVDPMRFRSTVFDDNSAGNGGGAIAADGSTIGYFDGCSFSGN